MTAGCPRVTKIGFELMRVRLGLIGEYQSSNPLPRRILREGGVHVEASNEYTY